MVWVFKTLFLISVTLAICGIIGLGFSSYSSPPSISHQVYSTYISGNFTCNLPIQPWFYAPVSEPIQVISFGGRVKELAEAVFRVEVGRRNDDVFLQHYLFYNVESLEKLVTGKKGKVLVLFSNEIMDLTTSFGDRSLHTSGPVHSFHEDWNYLKYVTTNSNHFVVKNITYYTDSDIVEELYNFLPYNIGVPLEKYLNCLPASNPGLSKRCIWFKKGFPFVEGECVF